MTNWLIPPAMMGVMIGIMALLRLVFHAVENLDEQHERASFKQKVKRVLCIGGRAK